MKFIKYSFFALVLFVFSVTAVSCTDYEENEKFETFSPDPDDDGTIDPNRQETGNEGG